MSYYIGYDAATSITSGSNNIFIGPKSGNSIKEINFKRGDVIKQYQPENKAIFNLKDKFKDDYFKIILIDTYHYIHRYCLLNLNTLEQETLDHLNLTDYFKIVNLEYKLHYLLNSI